MKAKITLLFLFISSLLRLSAMNNQATCESLQIYRAAIVNLELIKKEGGIANNIALDDFFKNLKNRIKITYSPSKNILDNFGLLGDNGDIDEDIRQAFKLHDEK